MVFLGIVALLAYRAEPAPSEKLLNDNHGVPVKTQIAKRTKIWMLAIAVSLGTPRLPPILALEWELEVDPFGKQCSGTELHDHARANR